LEEPLSDTLFLLTTSRKEKLLSTIVSRCQSVRCELLTDSDIEQALTQRENIPAEQSRLVSRLAGGDYSAAMELAHEDLVSERAEAVRFLRATLSGRNVPLLDDIEGRIAENDRGAVDQFLSLLLVWFRDAMLMKEQGAEGIINQDQQEDLLKFVSRFGNSNFSASIGAVERALELLRGNVYLPLVLLSLSVQLKRILLNAK